MWLVDKRFARILTGNEIDKIDEIRIWNKLQIGIYDKHIIIDKVRKIGWLSLMDTAMGGRGAGRGSSSTARGASCPGASALPTLQ